MIPLHQWYLSMVYTMTKIFLQSHHHYSSLVTNHIANKHLKLWKRSCGPITQVCISYWYFFIFFTSFLAPWDMQRLGAPFGHGFIMSCLSGCPNLNPTVGNLMASIPGCTLKFQKLMSEARLKLDQAATFILKFSSQD